MKPMQPQVQDWPTLSKELLVPVNYGQKQELLLKQTYFRNCRIAAIGAKLA